MNGSAYLVFKNIVLKDNVPTPYPEKIREYVLSALEARGKKAFIHFGAGVIGSCKLLSILRPLLGSSGRVECALHH